MNVQALVLSAFVKEKNQNSKSNHKFVLEECGYNSLKYLKCPKLRELVYDGSSRKRRAITKRPSLALEEAHKKTKPMRLDQVSYERVNRVASIRIGPCARRWRGSGSLVLVVGTQGWEIYLVYKCPVNYNKHKE